MKDCHRFSTHNWSTGAEIINNDSSVEQSVPILGFLQTSSVNKISSSSGRIVVYGDSNCLDNSNSVKGLFYAVTKI